MKKDTRNPTRNRRAALSLALFLFLLLIAPIAQAGLISSTASAEVWTCGTKSHYHAGYYQASGGPYYIGASARILTEYGAVCDTDTSQNNFTNEYSMISGYDSTVGQSGWAQSGYIRWYNSSITYFSQTTKAYPYYGLKTVYQFSPAIGETHSYIQKYSSSAHTLASIVDSTTFITTSWDPETAWGTNNSVQYDAETAYLESDIAGSVTTPVQYSGIQGQLDSTYAFSGVACSTLTHGNDGAATRADGESWHDIISPSCPAFISWTGTAG